MHAQGGWLLGEELLGSEPQNRTLTASDRAVTMLQDPGPHQSAKWEELRPQRRGQEQVFSVWMK